MAQRCKESLQTPFAIGHRDQFDFGSGEIAVGRDEREAWNRGGQKESFCGRDVIDGVLRERLVDRAAGRALSFLADAARRIGLGVAIDEQYVLVGDGKGSGQIDGGSGLTHATFLIYDGDDLSHLRSYDLNTMSWSTR